MTLPDDWASVLRDTIDAPAFADLRRFVAEERKVQRVFPPEDQVFAAFAATPFASTKVLLLGQDPYHGEGQAHGLCFSVPRGVARPPSLANLFRELISDLGVPEPNHGDLGAWARRGVLLLNATLTVREGEPGSHAGHGWELLTDAVVRALSARERPLVFVLFGASAKRKRALVGTRHRVVERAHPSPLSAHRGFLGTRPFSEIEGALAELAHDPIDWSLPP